MTFPHELFQNCFAAEAIIRDATEAGDILKAISTPGHFKRREFIIGSIDEGNLLEEVLSNLTNSEVIVECIVGTCGKSANEWVKNHLKDLLIRTSNEVKQLKFELRGDGFHGVHFDNTSLFDWSDSEISYLNAIKTAVSRGFYLDEILLLAQAMDQCILENYRKLLEKSKGYEIALYSSLFACSFAFNSNRAPGVNIVSPRAHSGTASIDSTQFVEDIKSKLNRSDLTRSELYLLLILSCNLPSPGEHLAPYLTSLIKNRWKTFPYHLQLQVLDVAELCWNASTTEKEGLIEQLNSISTSNLAISDSVTEALNNLGAFQNEEIEHEDLVKEEIESLLLNPNHEMSQLLPQESMAVNLIILSLESISK